MVFENIRYTPQPPLNLRGLEQSQLPSTLEATTCCRDGGHDAAEIWMTIKKEAEGRMDRERERECVCV